MKHRDTTFAHNLMGYREDRPQAATDKCCDGDCYVFWEPGRKEWTQSFQRMEYTPQTTDMSSGKTAGWEPQVSMLEWVEGMWLGAMDGRCVFVYVCMCRGQCVSMWEGVRCVSLSELSEQTSSLLHV